jgi:hypothetical protein
MYSFSQFLFDTVTILGCGVSFFLFLILIMGFLTSNLDISYNKKKWHDVEYRDDGSIKRAVWRRRE